MILFLLFFGSIPASWCLTATLKRMVEKKYRSKKGRFFRRIHRTPSAMDAAAPKNRRRPQLILNRWDKSFGSRMPSLTSQYTQRIPAQAMEKYTLSAENASSSGNKNSTGTRSRFQGFFLHFFHRKSEEIPKEQKRMRNPSHGSTSKGIIRMDMPWKRTLCDECYNNYLKKLDERQRK